MDPWDLQVCLEPQEHQELRETVDFPVNVEPMELRDLLESLAAPENQVCPDRGDLPDPQASKDVMESQDRLVHLENLETQDPLELLASVVFLDLLVCPELRVSVENVERMVDREPLVLLV